MKKAILFLMAIIGISRIYAQTDSLTSRKNAINIYIDAENIQYIKEQITFVNYVRDMKNADVHILESMNIASNGGTEYTYIFTGQKKFKDRNDTLRFVTNPDNSNDEIRKRQVQILKLGLMQYVAHSEFADDISIKFNKPVTNIIPEDKWKSWVFGLNSYAYLTGESSYKNYSLWSSVEASKITDEIKIEITYNNSFSGSVFKFDEGNTVVSKKTSNNLVFLLAKSIGNHWAVGYSGEIGNSTYTNKKISSDFYPTIEYNVFDYAKYNTIQLRLQYAVGVGYNVYYDTTIYNKTEQIFGRQKLSMAFKINKKWGYINSSVSFSNYMYDFSKNSLKFNNSVSVRVFKGFSVSFTGMYAIIHDQIYLPKGDLSYEDILLRQQQISTDYTYWLTVGINYTFGSIYNNIVNPRFNYIY